MHFVTRHQTRALALVFVTAFALSALPATAAAIDITLINSAIAAAALAAVALGLAVFVLGIVLSIYVWIRILF